MTYLLWLLSKFSVEKNHLYSIMMTTQKYRAWYHLVLSYVYDRIIVTITDNDNLLMDQNYFHHHSF